MAVAGTLADASLRANFGGGYVPGFADEALFLTHQGTDAVDRRFAELEAGL